MFSKKPTDFINRKVAGMEIILLNYAGRMEAQAKSNAKWTDRTSHARQRLKGGVDKIGKDKFEIYLAHGVEYGIFLEEGTKPHTIKAKGKALYWDGADHPVRQVQHPGTQGDKLLERTLNQNKQQLLSDIAKWWED